MSVDENILDEEKEEVRILLVCESAVVRNTIMGDLYFSLPFAPEFVVAGSLNEAKNFLNGKAVVIYSVGNNFHNHYGDPYEFSAFVKDRFGNKVLIALSSDYSLKDKALDYGADDFVFQNHLLYPHHKNLKDSINNFYR